jgi:hypothetical protein
MNSKYTPVIEVSPLLVGIGIGFISGCLATLLLLLLLL